MKYQPPLNSTPTVPDPEPSYFNGNKQAGLKGAQPPGEAIEHPMREVLNVILAAGLTPTPSDLTQLQQAIMILAGGVGGAPASFGLNPVFPECITNGGVMSITPSVGQVVLATGQQWIHRGGTLYNSTSLTLGERTLSTVASKTYHMRWRYNAGVPTLLLYDLADVGYNPGAVAETDEQFDTAYDDMLIARVVTNGSNVPVVTALYNKNRLSSSQEQIDSVLASSGLNGATGQFFFPLNWARTPVASVSPRRLTFPGVPDQTDFDFDITPTISRYTVDSSMSADHATFMIAFMRAWA